MSNDTETDTPTITEVTLTPEQVKVLRAAERWYSDNRNDPTATILVEPKYRKDVDILVGLGYLEPVTKTTAKLSTEAEEQFKILNTIF